MLAAVLMDAGAAERCQTTRKPLLSRSLHDHNCILLLVLNNTALLRRKVARKFVGPWTKTLIIEETLPAFGTASIRREILALLATCT